MLLMLLLSICVKFASKHEAGIDHKMAPPASDGLYEIETERIDLDPLESVGKFT